MYRTGTSSLGQALSWLGYKTTSHFLPLQGVASLDYFDLDSTKWMDVLPQVERYLNYMDAFTDAPWIYLYKELDRRYPDAQFILTIRSSTQIVAESEVAHWKSLGLEKKLLEETKGGKDMITMEMMFEERYEQHNRAVTDYLQGRGEKKFMVLCLEEEGRKEGSQGAWKKLCGFLGGLSVPDLPFPYLNRRDRGDRLSR